MCLKINQYCASPHTRLQRNHVATKGQVNVSRLNVSLRYTVMNGPAKQRSCPLERTRTAALSSAVQSKNTQNSWHFTMHSFPEAVVVVTLAAFHKCDLFSYFFLRDTNGIGCKLLISGDGRGRILFIHTHKTFLSMCVLNESNKVMYVELKWSMTVRSWSW